MKQKIVLVIIKGRKCKKSSKRIKAEQTFNENFSDANEIIDIKSNILE